MGELDCEIFELPSDKEFCKIDLDQTISIPKKDIVLERVKVYPLNGKP
jgi:hypothetical protein